MSVISRSSSGPSRCKDVCRLLPPLLLFGLGGCARESAPSLPLMGSYFPAWLVCGLLGVVASVVARIVFIRLGIDELLPLRLLVYVCLALAVAFALSLTFFAR